MGSVHPPPRGTQTPNGPAAAPTKYPGCVDQSPECLVPLRHNSQTTISIWLNKARETAAASNHCVIDISSLRGQTRTAYHYQSLTFSAAAGVRYKSPEELRWEQWRSDMMPVTACATTHSRNSDLLKGSPSGEDLLPLRQRRLAVHRRVRCDRAAVRIQALQRGRTVRSACVASAVVRSMLSNQLLDQGEPIA